ncbi:MAG: protein YgfX [Pseudomonas sp.]|uniref:protein YgfX n=1 Tax=Pseudomonas sp. TaxID=306 RepID=UPI0033927DD8
MFSPSDGFECHWRPSRRLLISYLMAQAAAGVAVLSAALPALVLLGGVLGCLAHASWVLPRTLWLSSPSAFRGLRLNAQGWQLWSARRGWQAIRLAPDCVVLPGLVVLRFRLAAERRVRSLCLLGDSLAETEHRRLRVRLKFSRHRWAAAG